MLENDITIDFNNEHTMTYEKKIFNGGELHIKLDTFSAIFELNKSDDVHEVNFNTHLKNPYGIVELSLLKNAVETMVLQCGLKVKYNLVLTYLPYARQDRICNTGEAFSLKVFAQQLNALKFDEVYVYDAHSNVSLALIDNVINVGQETFFDEFFKELDETNTMLLSPDSGARTKTNLIGKTFNIPVIRAEKMRNPLTGEITGSILLDTIPSYVEKIIICDDICEYGGTFIALAKALHDNDFGGEIVLMITNSTLPYNEEHPIIKSGLFDEFIVLNQF